MLIFPSFYRRHLSVFIHQKTCCGLFEFVHQQPEEILNFSPSLTPQKPQPDDIMDDRWKPKLYSGWRQMEAIIIHHLQSTTPQEAKPLRSTASCSKLVWGQWSVFQKFCARLDRCSTNPCRLRSTLAPKVAFLFDKVLSALTLLNSI